MFDFIKNNFNGASVTLALTGLPITLSGEIIDVECNSIGLRLKGGKKVYVDADLIAFIY
ncbi:MAG: hypothetical protein H7Y18_00020 [Clostridiaceae bacterium]|nr:hypothetical protein [Clostridiaceae bacterium]